MNEFTAKKLGEVLAFCRVGAETIEKGHEGFVKVADVEKLEKTISQLNNHADMIIDFADKAGMKEVTLTKCEGTSNKLRAMRDMYVGEEWDNAAELLEWKGFFEGAAIVHWALVEGAAKSLDLAELADLADDAQDKHEDLLEFVSKSLEKIGSEKAKA
ncbi:MAG TPA: hypothetical protein VGE59_01535 [Patescibacteria group bacterium]